MENKTLSITIIIKLEHLECIKSGSAAVLMKRTLRLASHISHKLSTGASALLGARILRAAAAWGGQQHTGERLRKWKDAIDLPSTHSSCDAHAHIAVKSYVKSRHDSSFAHSSHRSKAAMAYNIFIHVVRKAAIDFSIMHFEKYCPTWGMSAHLNYLHALYASFEAFFLRSVSVQVPWAVSQIEEIKSRIKFASQVKTRSTHEVKSLLALVRI